MGIVFWNNGENNGEKWSLCPLDEPLKNMILNIYSSSTYLNCVDPINSMPFCISRGLSLTFFGKCEFQMTKMYR